MKFFFLLTVIVIASVAYFYFSGNPNQSIHLSEDIIFSSSTPPIKNSTGTKNSVPPGFKGPTGQPHIIGPSGNPPNY